MAKVPFTKLKLKTEEAIKTLSIIPGVEIEVKQYLPIQDKLKLIGDVVIQAHEEDFNYSNPVKIEVFRDLEMIFAYTNISFTDKQKEDLPKLYDQLSSSGVLKLILGEIPESEYLKISKGIAESVEAIYKYQSSVLGILDTIGTDYENLGTGFEQIYNTIKDPESLGVLKDVLTKLG